MFLLGGDIAPGKLTDQVQAQASVEETLRKFHLNAPSYISLRTLLAGRFEQQQPGCIAVISSVAGDRGRRPASAIFVVSLSF